MKKLLIHFFVLLTVMFSKNLTLESRFNPPARELMDVEIIGDIMIIPGNLDGYDFFDISDPTNPVHISNIEVPMGNRALSGFWVKAKDSVAYFSSRTRGEGSAIVNFNDPSDPVHIGSLSLDGAGVNNPSLEGLDILENMLAVAAHEDGVFIFDIDDPYNPDLNYMFECGNAWDVAFIDSNHIAIGNGEYGLILLEISCSIEPCSQTTIATEGAVKDVEHRDSSLYVAEGSAGIALYDISDLESPILLDQYDTEGLANKIALFGGNKVAVSDWEDVKILEWTGTELELVGYKKTGKRTMAIAARDSFIYSAEWQHLQTFRFGDINDADMDISSWDIAFPALEMGTSDTFELLIENNGQYPLGLIAPSLTHNDFYVVDFPEYMEPAESTAAKVIYTKSNQNASGIMQISTNDPDEPHIFVQLVGNYEGGIIGIDAPEFSLPIVANGTGTFTLSDHLGQIVVIAFFAPG